MASGSNHQSPVRAPVLPAAMQQAWDEREAAEQRFGGFYTQGEPQVTFNRIDSRYATQMGLRLDTFQHQRTLLQLKHSHRLHDKPDDEVVRLLEEKLRTLPSELEISMMPDPGGWQDSQRLLRAYFAALLRDADLRRKFVEPGYNQEMFSRLHMHAQARSRTTV